MNSLFTYIASKARLRWAFATLAGCAVALTCGAGCEVDREGQRLGALEERLRPGIDRSGKVGTLRALEVIHGAHRAAESQALRPDPGCEIDSGVGPVALEIELELTRYRGEEARQSWVEHRAYRRDDDGHEEVAAAAEFETELSLRGERRGRWILTGEGAFREEAPGRFSRRPLDVAGGDDLLAHGPGLLDELLSAVDSGWEPVQSEPGEKVWRAHGSSRLRCFMAREKAHDRAWKARIDARATLLEARLRVTDHEEDGRRRALDVRWRLGDGEQLVVRYADRLVSEPIEAVQAPEVALVIPGERDTSLARVGQGLEAWMERGWIDRRPWPPVEDEEE